MRLSHFVTATSAASLLVGLFLVSVITATPALAQAADSCPHEATVSSLQVCVQHAAEQGFIDNRGVTRSLLAKVAAAQQAVDRGQPKDAISALQAFVQEAHAQAGRHIEPEHAEHLIAHAQLVIRRLEALGTQ